jgi:Acetyltransferase (GNAT) domain
MRRYGFQYAAIGMLIVTPDKQRQGIGSQLMEAMVDRLEGRNVLLNATGEGLSLTTRLGFRPVATVRQHQGLAPTMPLPVLQADERVRPLGTAGPLLPSLDQEATGMDRSLFIDRIARDSQSIVLSRDHEPVGFAMLRRFGRGRVIAPLVAPDLVGAQVLATHWLGANAGKFCRIDASGGLGFSEWLEEMGLPFVESVTTMVRGSPPKASAASRAFAVAGQAFG